MKKLCLMLLAILLTLALCACEIEFPDQNTETPEPTTSVTPGDPPAVSPSPGVSDPVSDDPPVEDPGPFTAPAGSEVCGVVLDGMTREEAHAALADAAAAFTLTLDVSGTAISISGEQTGLTLDEALFDTFWQALEQGTDLPHILCMADHAALESAISRALEKAAKNPSVSYSSTQGKFVVFPGSNGIGYDVPSIAVSAGVALCSLTDSCSVEAQGSEILPAVGNDDPRLSAAAEAANSYLDLALSYSFTPDGGETVVETLSPSTIASFLTVSGNYSVIINSSAISNYAVKLGERHNGGSYTGDFITTGGQSVGYTVKYYGHSVDCGALANDIYNCVTNRVSGTRTAPYLPLAAASMPYGGSYVEIDLTSQQLWVYKNGVRVVSTPIVSGCVAEGNHTPTGVFSIYKKATAAWLAGPTWLDYVDYWMPFYGAYGLHDASWRSEFGGEIYIHEGSHGCPNLPVDVAGDVYNNISVGTAVIIYGGLTNAVDLTQEITGPAAYTHALSDGPFTLEYALKYDEAPVTFTSGNPDVVTIAEDGTVTIHNVGKADITISAAAFTHHTAAGMTVSVTILCPPDGHSCGEWVRITPPACETAGTESRTCSVCGSTETREIPATGHSYDEETGTCTVCGAIKPADDSDEPADENTGSSVGDDSTPAESEAPSAGEVDPSGETGNEDGDIGSEEDNTGHPGWPSPNNDPWFNPNTP